MRAERSYRSRLGDLLPANTAVALRAPLAVPNFVWRFFPRDSVTFEWRHLVFLNYAVPPGLLRPYLSPETELDLWEESAWLSVVGLLFHHTQLAAVPVPLAREYPQVNLRFYVKRMNAPTPRRGVTFLREIVPRCFIGGAARLLFNEKYYYRPMTWRVYEFDHGRDIEFSWQKDDEWARLKASPTRAFKPFPPGSHEEFISQRLWAYTPQRDGSTAEIHLQHPPWRVAPARHVSLAMSDPTCFGSAFADVLSEPPTTAFIAEGSDVVLREIHKIG